MALVLAILVAGIVATRPPASVGRLHNEFVAIARASATADRPSHRQCLAARRAVTYYAGVRNHWLEVQGAPNARIHGRSKCPLYLARVLRRKAFAARSRARLWRRDNYSWRLWLPDKWQRVGACETGYGRRPGSFSWDSGRYVSFAGIYRPAFDQHAHYIGQLGWDETKRRLGRLPTPREQYNVALEIWRRYGFSGWGCRNA